jgi:hypothetical protein
MCFKDSTCTVASYIAMVIIVLLVLGILFYASFLVGRMFSTFSNNTVVPTNGPVADSV